MGDDNIIGIDPDVVFDMAATLRAQNAVPTFIAGRLRGISTRGQLDDVTGVALLVLDEVVEEVALLANVMETYGNTSKAADVYPHLDSAAAGLAAAQAFTDARNALEGSLDDDVQAVPSVPWLEGSGLQDVFGRYSPANSPWVNDYSLPYGSYQRGGSVVGPDGRVYDIVVPEIFDANGNRFTADWDGEGVDSVLNLNGNDPGWAPVGYEVGLGHDGRQQSSISQGAIIIGSALGGPYGAAVDVRYGGGRPATLDEYNGLVFDENLRPIYAPTQPGSSPDIPTILEDPHGDNPFAGSRSGTAVSTGLAITDIIAGGFAGADINEHLQNEGNGLVIIQYSENIADGRLKATVVGVQLTVFDDGNVGISASHAGLNPQSGEFEAYEPVVPILPN